MRQRLTFLAPASSPIDSKSIVVTGDDFSYASYHTATAVEQRTTFSVYELPPKIGSILEYGHEIHIRWTKAISTSATTPMVSRLPAGLHVLFTPRDDGRVEHMCHTLKVYFGSSIKCENVRDTFSRLPVLSERFASTATYQYHQELSDLVHPIARLIRDHCPQAAIDEHEGCRTRLAAYLTSTSVDIDYDAVSHALVITAQWTQSPSSKVSSIPRSLGSIKVQNHNGSVEVGVLASEQSDEPEELKLGGFLTVVGEDEKPNPVLFAFPSRHHPLPSTDTTKFGCQFLQPTGLHPSLTISLSADTLRSPRDNCALHAYLTLPSALFLDRYQLSDQALLTSKNLRALHALSGADDLEAPDWAVKQWGSAALLELVKPNISAAVKTWDVEIPLHLRYLQAQNDTDQSTSRSLQIPWPVVFWACEAEDGLKMSTNPFDRVNLGYDGLFGPKTMFYHIPAAAGSRTVLDLKLPVLDPATAGWIPLATLTVVLAGIVWVLWSLLGSLPSANTSAEKKRQ